MIFSIRRIFPANALDYREELLLSVVIIIQVHQQEEILPNIFDLSIFDYCIFSSCFVHY